MKLRPVNIKGKHISEMDEAFRKVHGYPLTWTCSICDKWRLDAKISLHSIPIISPSLGNIGTENIRYCNDNLDCQKKAKEESKIITKF